MAKSAEEFKKECIMILQIYIRSVEKQIAENKNPALKDYLEAYRDSTKSILKSIEETKTE